MLKRRALNLISAFIIIILSWEVIADIVCAPFLPPPAAVLYNLCIDFIPKLWIHTLWSLIRIFSGIAVSVIIGMPAGLYMGYYKKLNRLLTPLLYLTYPVPKIALLPVVILLFGMGEISKIVMIVMIVLFQIIIALRDAALGIPKEAFYLAASLGAGTPAIFRRVIIPASIPALITAIRLSLGTAMSVLFFTETFGVQYGLGFFIMDSWIRVDYKDMFSGIVVLSIIGIALFIIIDFIERSVCRWRREQLNT